MSAPNRSIRDSEELGYGLLSARASVALRHALGAPLSTDDVAVLNDAARFLKEISDGALITTGNVRVGVSASRSVAALDVAFGPLETLKQWVQTENEIAPFFQDLSNAVYSVAQGADTGTLTPKIEHAQQFFDALSSWLLEELSAKNRPLGKGSLTEL